MTPRKGRGGRPNNHHNSNYMEYNQNNQYLQQYPGVTLVSDYESDNLYSFTVPQQQQQQQQQPSSAPPPPSRSNEELNISVLRRHNPAITSILSLAPYAVVYIFNPVTQQWEKNGMEGSMFVCQLVQGSLGQERYSVFVLNRRGLNNFDLHLDDGDNVEITDEFVILKSDARKGLQESNTGADVAAPASQIYGLWIFSEPPPSSTAETRKINAQVIKECAIHAGKSLLLAQERITAEQRNGQAQSSVPMGRQLSLKELFGQQRAQDEGLHSPGLAGSSTDMVWDAGTPGQVPAAQAIPQPQPNSDVLGDLFRRAGLVHQS